LTWRGATKTKETDREINAIVLQNEGESMFILQNEKEKFLTLQQSQDQDLKKNLVLCTK